MSAGAGARGFGKKKGGALGSTLPVFAGTLRTSWTCWKEGMRVEGFGVGYFRLRN